MKDLDLITTDERLQSLLSNLICADQTFGMTAGFEGDEQIHNGLSDLISDVQGSVNHMQDRLMEQGLECELHARAQVMHVRDAAELRHG